MHWIRVRGATKAFVGELDNPAVIGGTTISPGDLVVLDGDGASSIAQARVADVVVASRERVQSEAENRERFARGEFSYEISDLRKVVIAASAGLPCTGN